MKTLLTAERIFASFFRRCSVAFDCQVSGRGRDFDLAWIHTGDFGCQNIAVIRFQQVDVWKPASRTNSMKRQVHALQETINFSFKVPKWVP
jgi:hypothetical protein